MADLEWIAVIPQNRHKSVLCWPCRVGWPAEERWVVPHIANVIEFQFCSAKCNIAVFAGYMSLGCPIAWAAGTHRTVARSPLLASYSWIKCLTAPRLKHTNNNERVSWLKPMQPVRHARNWSTSLSIEMNFILPNLTHEFSLFANAVSSQWTVEDVHYCTEI